MESIRIDNGTIISMNPRREIIHQGSVFIEGDKIQAVGKTSLIKSEHPTPDRIIDAKNQIVLPGLINAHCHCLGSLRRYLGADLPILEWLKTSKWPYQARIDKETAKQGARLGIYENIRFGNTTIIENYYPPRKSKTNVDETMSIAKKFGIRCLLARGCHDNPDTTPEDFLETPQEIIAEYRRLMMAYHNTQNNRLKVGVSPINLRNITPECYEALRSFADEHQLFIHTHVAEGAKAVEQVESQYGKPYIEAFHDHGLLSDRFQAAHAVWITSNEIHQLAKAKATVVYNPSSNMTLGSGVCKIPELLKAGVNVAFGADSPGSNWTMDLLSHLGLGALLQKVHHLNPKIISADTILEMATLGGARALKQEQQLGSLEPGKKADVILIRMNEPHLQPFYDPVAAVVYGATGTDVDTVIIDGQIVLKEKTFLIEDQEALIHSAAAAAYDFKNQVDSEISRK